MPSSTQRHPKNPEFYLTIFTGSNQCTENNGNCQHLCLANPGGRTCKCSYDHILVNETLCSPEQHCEGGSRPCLDQLSCQPVEKFCNGHIDCYDHSDENCEFFCLLLKWQSALKCHDTLNRCNEKLLFVSFKFTLRCESEAVVRSQDPCSHRDP